MTIKIGLLGTQGSGKTTNIYLLAGALKSDKKTVNIVPETAREAIKRGFRLDRKTDLNAQLWILFRQMEKELEAEVDKTDFLLTDRTVLDGIAYTRTSLGKREANKLQILATAYLRVKPYDMMAFFRPLESGPEADGIRDTSSDYIDKILKNMEDVVTEILHLPLYWVEGQTKKERSINLYEEVKSRFY